MKFSALSKLTLISILTLSTTVFADDNINWTGFYGSAMVGYTWGHVGEGSGFDNQLAPPAFNYPLIGSGGNSFNGVNGTLKLGYNKQIEANVIGLELGGTWQDGKSHAVANDGYYDTLGVFVPDTGLQSNTKINSYETFAVRAGHVFENTLVYISGGGALGQIKRSMTDTNGNWFGQDNTIPDNKTQLGYILGLGLEHKLDDRLSLRVNYEYVDFGKINFSYAGLFFGFPATITQSNSIHFSNLSAGVSYLF